MKSFFKNVLTMMSGTLAGQIIIIATMPIISRIYTPNQFGEYSNVVAIIGIISVLTTLKYDTGIAVTKNEEDKKNLIWLSFFINIVISVLVLILLLILSSILNIFEIYEIFYIFISILVIGNVQILTNIATASGHFKAISITKFSQSFTQVLLQLFGYLFHSQTLFLFLGYLIGKTNGIYILYKTNSFFIKQSKFNKRSFKKIMIEYKDYPLYGLPSSILNSVSANIVIILLLYFYGGFYAGIYGLIQRIMSGPLQLISKSFNSVLFKFTKDNGVEKIKKIYILTNIIIILFFGIIILFFKIVNFNLFNIVFGEKWGYANEIFLPLLFMMALQFTIIPFMELFTVYGKQRVRLLIDISRMILLFIVFTISTTYNLIFKDFVIIYSVSMCVFYLLMHLSMFKLLKSQRE